MDKLNAVSKFNFVPWKLNNEYIHKNSNFMTKSRALVLQLRKQMLEIASSGIHKTCFVEFYGGADENK